jgi:diguanylate cyclase (GGDEF)-like protein
MRVLLVEDDELIAEPLAKALREQHYAVDVVIDGQAGWELAQAFTYDLILLDVVLPQLDGVSLCRRLRSQGNQAPILLLTAQDTQTNRVMGLDAGADDYVTKPFDLQELLARIRARLRRSSTALPPVLTWQALQLDPSTCEVTCHQQILHLTPKEYSLLELFLRSRHRIFSCSALIDHLWSLEEPPGEDTVRSHIRGLRQKLRATGLADDPIENVYGIGYRLKEERQPEAVSLTPPEPAGMAGIWQQIQPAIAQRLNILEQAVDHSSRGTWTQELHQQAEQSAHKLVGSLGMFGSDLGSQLARKIEQLLTKSAPEKLSRAQSRSLAKLVANLRQELQQVPGWTAMAVPTIESPSPDRVAPQLPDLALRADETSQHPAPPFAKLVIVDDDLQLLMGLQRLLSPWGFQVTTLSDPQHVLSRLAENPPDLLILDVELPRISGIDLCQEIRSDPRWGTLPILFLTAHADAETMHRVFIAGADDFVSKPIVGPELVTRILNRLERSRLLQTRSDSDPLTGIANRRKSSQELKQLLQWSEHRQQPLCFAIVDLDHLKRINHQYGHAVGDQVLSRFGELLRQTFDHEAAIGRWGGTEFVVGLLGMTQEQGVQRLSQLLKQLQQIEFKSPERPSLHVTFSAAVVEFPQAGTDLETLYWAADTLLNRAQAPGQVISPDSGRVSVSKESSNR